ncbi:MAG TPA: hypothetical protein VE441_07540 [Mycobacterium sp.]|nr:hypothetical protein [Mycobacterium sp.]
MRQYKPPSANRYDGYGWLEAETTSSGIAWTLTLSAAPAEVPTHAC